MVLLTFAENSIQLVPDASLLLHVVLVLVMVGVLKATLYAPISRILEERERVGKQGGAGAAQMLRRVEGKASDYKRALRQARAGGYAYLQQERQNALSDRDERIRGVRDETAAWAAARTREVENQVAVARVTLEKSREELAQQISRRILEPIGGGGARSESQ